MFLIVDTDESIPPYPKSSECQSPPGLSARAQQRSCVLNLYTKKDFSLRSKWQITRYAKSIH